jgi:drug/metabolite transporter (DMT)-like permease
MVYLLLTVLFSTLFGVGLKLSEAKGRDRMVVAFFNYAAGVVMAFVFWISPLAESPMKLSLFTFYAGLAAGAAWVAGLLTMMISIRASGIALTTAISRLSVVVPMAACVLLWGETMKAMEGIGAALAVGAVLLLGSRAAQRKGRITSQGIILLFCLMVAQSMAQITLKIFERYCPGDEVPGFILILFLAGTLLTGAWIGIRGNKVRRGDIVFGVLVGLPNLLTGAFQTLALLQVKGTIVFPVTNVGSVLLLSLLGLLIWKEKLGRRGLIGILLTLLGLLLIHLAKGMQ